MPPRIARSSLPSSKPKSTSGPKSNNKAARKGKARSLNAFAIAQHTAPEVTKIRQHRLGETTEDDVRPQRKRARTSEDEDDEDDEGGEPQRRQQKSKKGRFDELDISEGSDSEGNHWQYGVGDDDDSDIDSDEAFGESDEEKFEGFTFRGGANGKAGGKRKKPAVKKQKDLDLDEDDESEKDSEDELEEEGIDLATMLDQGAESASEGEYEEQAKSKLKKSDVPQVPGIDDDDNDDDDDDDDGDDDESSMGDDEEDGNSVSGSDTSMADDFADFDEDSDDNDTEKQKQLQSLVASYPDAPEHEAEGPLDSQAKAARMLSALQGMSGVDPSLTRSLKTMSRSTDPKSSKSTSATNNNGMVKVPLPPRQQGRIDRGAAYEKTIETLNRWQDTVKHNRRAEHLTFPLVDPQAQEAQGTSKLLPLDSRTAPRNALESTIADILQASGLAEHNTSSKTEEEALRGFEELATNKMPLEEVLARRAELRKNRDLMFREEAKSKRIKKIKSKAYRRVHRKEAQREAQKEQDMLAAAGVVGSEDEAEEADRRRAEARMGGRIRESRWAKSVKETGRGAWDENARDSMAVAARKNEEVMMRREGKRIKEEGESGESDSESDDDEEDAGDEFVLRKQLDRLDEADNNGQPKSKVGQMAFMQRADAARRKQNEEDIERMKRELNGEEEEERAPAETSLGRRIFGPSADAQAAQAQKTPRGEFEEGDSDDDDEDDEIKLTATPQDGEAFANVPLPAPAKSQRKLQAPKKTALPHLATKAPPAPPTQSHPAEEQEEPVLNLTTTAPSAQTSTAPSNTDGWTTVHYSDDDNSDGEVPASPSRLSRSPSPTNLELVQAAFGTADDTAAFEAEKADHAQEEDTKTVSTALPGWGSWTGSGLSRATKAASARALKNPLLTKTTADGIAPEKRKDRKLKDVILSERRNKKGAKYLAPQLPHEFENRAQYERSLRVPIGPEWSTKETFQGNTKPRVLLKKGRIVKPMERPMV